MEKIITDFFGFIKTPTDQKIVESDSKKKIHFFLTIFIIDLVISASLILIIELFASLGVVNNATNEIEVLMQQYSEIAILISIVIVVPIIEELIFRSQIRFEDNFIIRLKSKKVIKNELRRKWDKYYTIIFYIPVILFTLFHIANYDSGTNSAISLTILVLPILFLGVLFGYIRVRVSLLASILYHIFHNLLAVLIYTVF